MTENSKTQAAEADRNLKIHNLLRCSKVAGILAVILLGLAVGRQSWLAAVTCALMLVTSVGYAWSATKIMDGSAN